MRVLAKKGDEVLLVYSPGESVEVGENIEIIEEGESRGILVQVIEENLLDLPGILEDIVRHEVLSSSVEIVEKASKPIEKLVVDVKNMKIARAKIRKEIRISGGGAELRSWSGWTPSRRARIRPLPLKFLTEALNIGVDYHVKIGRNVHDGSDLIISAYDLQGINIIVGKKGTGKSHLAKTILLGLIDHGARCVVFDINDEYSGLRYASNGEPSPYYDKIVTLEPSPPEGSRYVPLKFTLPYIGLEVMYSVMVDVLKLPDASAATFREIWNELERGEILTLTQLYKASKSKSSKVAEAIYRRLKQVEETRIITDKGSEETRIEELLEDLSDGGALVVNLKAKSITAQSIVVQTIISKIRQMLEDPDSTPLFIFAEEAHIYLQRIAWLDLVTRMRHLGAFQFYMTNTPTSIDEIIVRQTDNIVIFNLTNKRDIEHLLPAAKIDDDTVKSITPALPPRTFLAIGQATSDYPFIAETIPLPYQTAGRTRLLWTRE